MSASALEAPLTAIEADFAAWLENVRGAGTEVAAEMAKLHFRGLSENDMLSGGDWIKRIRLQQQANSLAFQWIKAVSP